MFGLGTTELIVIGIIILLIFGARRLPEIGKGLGGAIREFRQIKKEVGSTEVEERAKKPEEHEEKNKPLALENKLAGKVVEQIPGVKKAMDVKNKVDKVKEIIS